MLDLTVLSVVSVREGRTDWQNGQVRKGRKDRQERQDKLDRQDRQKPKKKKIIKIHLFFTTSLLKCSCVTWLVGFVKVVAQIVKNLYMDFSKLLHGFAKFVIWILTSYCIGWGQQSKKNVFLGIFSKRVDPHPPSLVNLGILASFGNKNVNFLAKNNGHQNVTKSLGIPTPPLI